MTQPGSHHDHLIKTLLGRPSTADILFRERLPPGIVALMTAEPPRLLSGSFVDTKQRSNHTDLLYEIGLTEGRNALVQVLIEHDSRRRSNPLVLPKLLRYVAVACERHLGDGRGLPLTPVIPLVICHGTTPWAEPPDFADLFDVGPELAGFVPRFRYAVFDLCTTGDRDLSRDPFLRLGLLVLKLARSRADFRRRLLDLATDEIYRDDRMAQLLVYMLNVYTELDRETLLLLAAGLSEEEQSKVTTLAQRLFAEGKAEGVQEGILEGKSLGVREGKTVALLKVLEVRFGPIPVPVRQRVENADSDTIDAWLGRAIEAASLEQVTDPEKG